MIHYSTRKISTTSSSDENVTNKETLEKTMESLESE